MGAQLRISLRIRVIAGYVSGADVLAVLHLCTGGYSMGHTIPDHFAKRNTFRKFIFGG